MCAFDTECNQTHVYTTAVMYVMFRESEKKTRGKSHVYILNVSRYIVQKKLYYLYVSLLHFPSLIVQWCCFHVHIPHKYTIYIIRKCLYILNMCDCISESSHFKSQFLVLSTNIFDGFNFAKFFHMILVRYCCWHYDVEYRLLIIYFNCNEAKVNKSLVFVCSMCKSVVYMLSCVVVICMIENRKNNYSVGICKLIV